MYRFWNTIIEAAFQILKPKTIVEIGVDAGKQTELVLAYCRQNQAVLHAIDPKPCAEVDAWTMNDPQHLVVHQDISLNVLGTIDDVDAVLIDGDHNWYTVFHELRLLEETAARTGRFPVIFLHDTGWPYGRRDLYYAPARIPDAYRKAYAQKGIVQGQGLLTEYGGMNPTLYHAIEENTLQNGVLTAVEDFLEQSSFDLRFVHIPGLHGLGIIAPLALLEALPAFSSFLNTLQTGKVMQEHIDDMEQERTRALVTVRQLKESKELLKEQAVLQKNNMQRELEKAADLTKRYQDTIAALSAEIARIRQSRSWRWTKPVRSTERLLRHIIRKEKFNTSRKTSVEKPKGTTKERLLDFNKLEQWTEDAGYTLIGAGKKVWVGMGSPFPRFVRSMRVHVLGSLWHVRPAPPQTTAIKIPLHPVTIVIPVFNAYDETVRCLESVLRETTAPLHRILIIDDASTDARMEPFLTALVAREPERVTVLKQAENHGFVQSANIGLRAAQGNDIVLLNSDTIVTPLWLEHLRETAYLRTDTASVTPLSNEASIYSVFQGTIDAALSKNPLNDLARSITHTSKKLRPAIPTGVGFCLFMRHEALEKTGLFDERFEKGYAEENDWCMRARALGFRHYLDDACFIYHKGHVSMEAAGIHAGSDAVEKNEALLRSLHPQYEMLVTGFLSSTVMTAIRTHVETKAAPDAGRRLRIAFVLHQPIRQHSVGGTEFHVSDLVEQMRATADCFILYPDRHDIVVMQENPDGRDPQFFRYRKGGKTEADICETFTHIFDDYGFDVVHIHHTLGLSFDLLPLAKRHGMKVVYSIHDWLCMNEQPATICARNEDMIDPLIVEKRQEALRAADILVAPSHFVQKFVSTVFELEPGVLRMIEHGIPAGPPAAFLPFSEPLVCFFGSSHIPYKGKPVIATLVPLLQERGIRVAFLGSDAYEWPELRHNTSVTFHGFYERSDVNERLHTIAPHLVCLLSLWPETFSYTLSEAWAAGIPAYVTPMGAQQERVLRHGGGRVAPSLDPKEIADDIASFLRSPEYQQTLALTRSIRLPDVRDMARQYQDLYQAIAKTGSAA